MVPNLASKGIFTLNAKINIPFSAQNYFLLKLVNRIAKKFCIMVNIIFAAKIMLIFKFSFKNYPYIAFFAASQNFRRQFLSSEPTQRASGCGRKANQRKIEYIFQFPRISRCALMRN